jgi:hypothetical protein
MDGDGDTLVSDDDGEVDADGEAVLVGDAVPDTDWVGI